MVEGYCPDNCGSFRCDGKDCESIVVPPLRRFSYDNCGHPNCYKGERKFGTTLDLFKTFTTDIEDPNIIASRGRVVTGHWRRGDNYSYYEFELRYPLYESYDIRVGDEQGNYAGGDKKLENVTKDQCIQLFKEWFNIV